MHSPGGFVLQFEVKNHVVLRGKFEDLFQRRHFLTHKLAIEPHSRVQLSDLRQGEILDVALTIRGAFERGVMYSHKLRIPRQVQVCLNESRSKRHRSLERGERVLRSITGSSAMRDDPGFPHG